MKSNILLMAFVFLGINCILVNTNCQKKYTTVISYGKQKTEKTSTNRVVTFSEKVFEIKEKMFMAQVNDVYLNPEDYLGKTIKLEGLFKREQYAGQEKQYCFVIRYGPGCCGSDGNAGFEISWNDEAEKILPNVDDWVEATGVLAQYPEDDYPYLYIALSDLKVLDKRGSEFVAQ